VNKKNPAEILHFACGNRKKAGRLADTIAAPSAAQARAEPTMLEMFEGQGAPRGIWLSQLETEIAFSRFEKRIRGRVKRRWEGASASTT